MLTTRVLTSLAAAAVALVLAPAASSARPIYERAAQESPLHGCYQLDPVVPGQLRGVHRVPCGVDVPSAARPKSRSAR